MSSSTRKFRAFASAISILIAGCVGSVDRTTGRGDRAARASDAEEPDVSVVDAASADGGLADDGSTGSSDAAELPDAEAVVDGGPPDATASPDTAPPPDVAPAMLPLPDGSDVVDDVAREHPDWLRDSCLETGGSNAFVFEVVRRLRLRDDRWGLNWKRGVVGDMSQDVIDYHWGSGPREGSADVYILDIIVGHCGPAPGVGWLDQTEATAMAGTIGRWTLAPLP